MMYFTTIIDHTAGAGTSEIYVSLPIDARLNAVSLVPNMTTTAHASNYVTYNLKDNAAANIFTANTSTGSGATLTGGTPVSVALLSSADLDFAAGEVCRLQIVDAASGADANLTVVWEFAPARSV